MDDERGVWWVGEAAARRERAGAADDASTGAFAPDEPAGQWQAFAAAPWDPRGAQAPAHETAPPPPRRTGTAPAEILGALREQAPAPGPPAAAGPDTGRWVLIGLVVLLPVLAVVALVALLPGPGGGGTPTAPGTASPQASAATTPETSASGSATPSATPTTPAVGDVRTLEVPKAAALVAASGVRVPGTIEGAWTWTDRNGGNLLVTTVAVNRRAADGSVRAETLRVSHLTGLDGVAGVARTMTDPLIQNCPDGSEVDLGFTPGSVQVEDLDGDGVAEVLVGWHAFCGTDVSAQTVKLALISDGRKFILRGKGYPGGNPVVGDTGSARFTPDPAASAWPAPYLDAATALFDRLYS
jgi:hypothetical protein